MEKVLDLGCGSRKTPGSLGVDCLDIIGVDKVHNLDVYPWPLPSDAFELIICRDILEHLSNMVSAMGEIYRIGMPGARVIIQGPSACGFNLAADPTHIRGFNSKTFNYFIPGTQEYQYGYSTAKYRTIKSAYIRQGGKHWISWADGLVTTLANRFKDTYEARFIYLYPIPNIAFELEILK